MEEFILRKCFFNLVAKRLTKEQKLEIVKGYRLGKSSVILAKEFSCSANTVNRTVKGIIPIEEYRKIQELRVIDLPSEEVIISNNIHGDQLLGLKNNNDIDKKTTDDKECSSQSNVQVKNPDNDQFNINKTDDCNLPLEYAEDFSVEFNESSLDDSLNSDIESNNSLVFQEISPLISDFGFEQRKQKTSTQNLSLEILPQSLYMLVDKRVELETMLLRDLPDWSFLPEDEKVREAINLFTNQRTAKRNCVRGQRVIKVPNPNAFILSKPFLLAKGITRLVLDDLLIALD